MNRPCMRFDISVVLSQNMFIAFNRKNREHWLFRSVSIKTPNSYNSEWGCFSSSPTRGAKWEIKLKKITFTHAYTQTHARQSTLHSIDKLKQNHNRHRVYVKGMKMWDLRLVATTCIHQIECLPAAYLLVFISLPWEYIYLWLSASACIFYVIICVPSTCLNRMCFIFPLP